MDAVRDELLFRSLSPEAQKLLSNLPDGVGAVAVGVSRSDLNCPRYEDGCSCWRCERRARERWAATAPARLKASLSLDDDGEDRDRR